MRAARARAACDRVLQASPPTEDARSGDPRKRPAPRPSAPCVPELRLARWADQGAEVFGLTGSFKALANAAFRLGSAGGAVAFQNIDGYDTSCEGMMQIASGRVRNLGGAIAIPPEPEDLSG